VLVPSSLMTTMAEIGSSEQSVVVCLSHEGSLPRTGAHRTVLVVALENHEMLGAGRRRGGAAMPTVPATAMITVASSLRISHPPPPLSRTEH